MPSSRAPKPAKDDALLKELREIKHLLRNILEEEEEQTPPHGWRRIWLTFSLGMVKGFGVLIGATLVAAIFFIILQQVLEITQVQSAITDFIITTMRRAHPDLFTY